MKLIKIFMPFCILLLSSCSSYINQVHRDIDAEERRYIKRKPINPFDQFRDRSQKDLSRRQKGQITSERHKNLTPRIKRKYQPIDTKKRYKADDLDDNASVGSLWAGEGNDSYLFSRDTEKQTGDIIQIDVFSKLKNEITLELKRTFPEKKTREKDDAKKDDKKKTAQPATPKSGNGTKNKVHDRISTVVIEEINKDHLLLRGRKALLYKQRKRLVEIQVLVSRKDISDDDTIASDKVLESSIHVLR